MSNFSIDIQGSNNDSKLILESTSGSINISTSTFENKIENIEDYLFNKVLVQDIFDYQYNANYIIQNKFQIINLPNNNTAGEIKLLPGTVGPNNDYSEYITYLTSLNTLEVGGAKEKNLPINNLPLFYVNSDIKNRLRSATLGHFDDNMELGVWMENNGYSTTLTSPIEWSYDFTNMPLWNAQDSFGNLQFNDMSLSTYLSPKMTLSRSKVVVLIDIEGGLIKIYTGYFQNHSDFSGNSNADGSAKNYWEPHNTWVFYEKIVKSVEISDLTHSVNTLENNSLTLESSMNVLDNFVGDKFGFHIDKNLNGGVPMVNSILPISDDDLTLTNLKFIDDPSNIRLGIGGQILTRSGNNNGFDFNTRLKFENKATFNLTKNGVSLASSYNNKLYVADLFNNKSFGFGNSINLFPLGGWWGTICQFHIAKDLSDNFIFKLGGGSVNTDGNYSHWSSINNGYVYNYHKYFMSSNSLLYNDFSNSTYIATTPFSDPSANEYQLESSKKLLINMSRNFYIDVNENMELFDPMNTLLKGSNYPYYGSVNFDISVNKNIFINDVSGFAIALNNFELFDSMSNLQAYSDTSFNNDLNIMCFGSSFEGSDFNFTGILYIMGYVTDLSSQLHRFNFAAVGSINGNYNYITKELSGKQNLYLNIMAHESSKTSFFNNRTVLISWDTNKPNVPKYVSLLPELVGNKISIYNKEIVMQI